MNILPNPLVIRNPHEILVIIIIILVPIPARMQAKSEILESLNVYDLT